MKKSTTEETENEGKKKRTCHRQCGRKDLGREEESFY